MLPDTLCLLVVATLSMPQPALPPPMPPVFRFASVTPPPPSALTREAAVKPLRHPVAKKATAAVAGAVLGYFAGVLQD